MIDIITEETLRRFIATANRIRERKEKAVLDSDFPLAMSIRDEYERHIRSMVQRIRDGSPTTRVTTT